MTQAIGMKIGAVHPDIQRAWGVDGWMNRRRYHISQYSRARILRLARSDKYEVFQSKRYFVICRLTTSGE